jgi:SMI1/KNR4 family protein SUKH-1
MDRITEIFRLAGREPAKANGADEVVREVEHRIGMKLPSSFRQLLLFDSAMDLLRKHSGGDDPIDCSELGNRLERWDEWDACGPTGQYGYDPLSDKLLPFMIENQGVCTWAVELENGDDPRVFIEVDAQGRPEWQLTATTFTDWLASRVKDHLLLESASFAAQAPELDDDGMDLLRRRFQEGYATFAWPGRVNYRFSNAHADLLLWSNEGQCDWWIKLMPDAQIDDALDQLSNIQGLVQALYVIGEGDVKILQAWKRRHTKM